MKNKCIVLMPLSQYKKGLYRHVETFNLANPKLFKDAVVQENLCITTCRKSIVDKYSWMDLVLASVDQRYIEYYKWNIAHNKCLFMKRGDYNKPENFNIDLDFLETSRCTYYCSGARFGPNSMGYKYNVLKNIDKLNADIGCIHFNTKLAKDNFTKYVYSWKNPADKINTMNNRVVHGVHAAHASGENYFIWPQIDWSSIHINQKELWDKGLYDEAVLAEMGLKYDSSIDAITRV
jgi:hypothetical protein